VSVCGPVGLWGGTLHQAQQLFFLDPVSLNPPLMPQVCVFACASMCQCVCVCVHVCVCVRAHVYVCVSAGLWVYGEARYIKHNNFFFSILPL